MTQTYVPGVCNIGPEEIARRRRLGWTGLLVALVLFVGLFWFGANPWWRLLVFFPAALSASGFLQAYFQFCSGFGRRGVFNFGSLGQMTNIADDESKQKDRKRGSRIAIYAFAIGAIVALVCVYV